MYLAYCASDLQAAIPLTGSCPSSCKALGDMGRLLAAVGASEFSQQSLCELRPAALREIRRMRLQLTEELNLLVPDWNLTVNPKMPPPSQVQMVALRQIILCAMADNVAKKKHGKVGRLKGSLSMIWATFAMKNDTLHRKRNFHRLTSVCKPKILCFSTETPFSSKISPRGWYSKKSLKTSMGKCI